MDRRLEIVGVRLPHAGIILAAALGAAGCWSTPDAGSKNASEDQPQASDIRALQWVAEGAERVKLLTETPMACESPAASPDIRQQRNLGRLAFGSPALLGGSAARMEMSCESCHRAGRGNPDFFLNGLSDKPGTADVTSSMMSKVRGDGNFNPVVIPDLAARDGKQLKDRTSAEFHSKVRGLVIEEFDGQPPPPLVFDALIAYLDGLTLCPPSLEVVGIASADGDLLNARMAAEAAEKLRASSPEAARFYVRTARYSLQRVHERFIGADMADIRERLAALSRTLADRLEGANPSPLADPGDWGWLELQTKLRGMNSLYEPAVLSEALAD